MGIDRSTVWAGLLSALAATCLAGAAHAATLYVSTTGSDANDGSSWTTPFQSVEAAVAAASAGDTVVVSNGTYATSAQITIDKALTIRGIGTAEDTTISGGGSRRCFLIGAGGDATIENLTIAYGRADGGDYNGLGGGVLLIGESESSAAAIFRRCVFTYNYSRNYGGAACVREYATAEFENCVIAGNHSQDSAALITWEGTSRMILRNCNVIRNIFEGNGCIISRAGSTEILNSIVWDNKTTGGSLYNYASWGGAIVLSNSCVNPVPNYAVNCTDNDPVFLDAGNGIGAGYTNGGNWIGNAYTWDGDLRLGPSSPCIDTGAAEHAPAIDFAGNARPQDGDGDGTSLPDMGAYEADGPNSGPFRCSASSSTSGGLVPLPVNFSVALAGANTSGAIYYWDFGDGTTLSGADLATPSHTYAVAGSYSATVSITNSVSEGTSALPMPVLASPATIYVSPNGGNVVPYDTWAKAATSIQAAIDVSYGNSSTSSVVRVTNGVYQLYGSSLTITAPVTVESVEGYESTIVVGDYANQFRCVYVDAAASDVTLCGFTFTNGWAGRGKAGGDYGGNVYLGGARGTVRDCLITGGYTTDRGGGVGIRGSDCLLENCLIAGNSTGNYAGGLTREDGSVFLRNCTVVGNYSPNSPSGLFGAAISAINCIIYDNTSNGENQSNQNTAHGQSYSYCCTTPLPSGDGNISGAPLFADAAARDYHLNPGSPCIDSGTSTGAPAADLDGVARPQDGDGDNLDAYDMGCFEAPDAKSGPLAAGFSRTPSSGLAPLSVAFSLDSATGSNTNGLMVSWDFGDGTAQTAYSYDLSTNHVYTAPGRYIATGYARNNGGETYSAALAEIVVAPSDVYVSTSGAAVFPYATPATAANDLATALTAAYGDATCHSTIHVLPGTYPVSTVIAMGMPVAIRGEGRADEVVFDGEGRAIRGFLLSDGASGALLENLTITRFYGANSRTGYGGGIQVNGATGVTMHACRIVNNTADDRGGGIGVTGGGSLTIRDCLVAGNRTTNAGGGITVEPGTLVIEGCTITRNCGDPNAWLADKGPGINVFGGNSCTIRNSIIYGNGAAMDPTFTQFNIENWNYVSIDSSCTYPLPNNGSGCITNDPGFVSYGTGVGEALAGYDFHLLGDSACRNAGSNALVRTTLDLDGKPRVVRTVEMGCYEIQSSGTLFFLK